MTIPTGRTSAAGPSADTRTGATALLVVDVQRGLVDAGPWAADEVLGNIAALIAACRGAGVEVVHVQHDGQPGEPEEPGTHGWEIHPAVRPAPGEKLVRKRFNSAFRGTDLLDHLRAREIGRLIVIGMQTEYCIDTTCRVAFEHGFRLVMPEMTNTTLDSGELTGRQIQEHFNRRIFAGRFASAPTMTDALRIIEEAGRAEGDAA